MAIAFRLRLRPRSALLTMFWTMISGPLRPGSEFAKFVEDDVETLVDGVSAFRACTDDLP